MSPATSVRTSGLPSQKRTVKPEPPPLTKKPGTQSLAVFFRSLAVMFASGVTIDRALVLLSVQDDKAMAAVSERMAEQVRNGNSMSQAMAKNENAFTKMHYKLVQVGEATGNLDMILDQLSVYEEKRQATSMKVKSALTYPCFLFAACCLMLIILPPYMLGGIFQVIKSSGGELPLVSKIVLGAAMWMRTPSFYFVLVVTLVGGFFFLRQVWTQENSRRAIQRWALEAPGLGKLVRALGLSRFARAWSIQVAVGVAPVAALQLAAESTMDPCLEEDISYSVTALRDGCSMQASLDASGYFPSLFLQMVAVGEESGGLEAMVARVAAIYEQQLEHTLETLTALLEPAVMLVMGCIVGLIVVATMLPMMQMLQSFS